MNSSISSNNNPTPALCALRFLSSIQCKDLCACGTPHVRHIENGRMSWIIVVPAQWVLRKFIFDRVVLPVHANRPQRSEGHTSELQSLMRISYAVFCLKQTT